METKKYNYKYTREEIKDMIMLSPQTRDGHYWCPEIRKKILMVIKNPNEKTKFNYIEESKYIIDRNYFTFKSFYCIKDLKYLLATFETNKLFVDDWVKLNSTFEVDNEDLLDLPITAYINNNRLGRIIDYYLSKLEYIYNI